MFGRQTYSAILDIRKHVAAICAKRIWIVAAFTLAVSEASLAFWLVKLRRENKTPQEVAALVSEKFEGHEKEIAIKYLRMQHQLTNRRKVK